MRIPTNRYRRRLLQSMGLGVSTIALAAFRQVPLPVVEKESEPASAVGPFSFNSLHQVRAGVLDVGYHDAGRVKVALSFSCTVIRTIFTASLEWLGSLLRMAAALSYRICAATVRHAS